MVTKPTRLIVAQDERSDVVLRRVLDRINDRLLGPPTLPRQVGRMLAEVTAIVRGQQVEEKEGEEDGRSNDIADLGEVALQRVLDKGLNSTGVDSTTLLVELSRLL